jgi:hypothetical protein
MIDDHLLLVTRRKLMNREVEPPGFLGQHFGMNQDQVLTHSILQ